MKKDCSDDLLWMNKRINSKQITKYLDKGRDFIDHETISEALDSKNNSCKEVEDILEKSLAIKTLSLNEAAVLLNVRDPQLLEKMQIVAQKVKKKVYDNRIVTFAPLYLSNACVNNCLYCGFRSDNKQISRKVLSSEEVAMETESLAGKIGHKRLIVVYGESPQSDIDYIAKTINTIYQVKVKTRNGWGRIRRVNVNASPMSIEDLKVLKDAGIGTYQVFQETYNRQTYSNVHPQGTIKGDYKWRLYAMHRAFEAGIDDVGIGVLFGLDDWKFEVLGLLSHAHELEAKFGIGPHTVSFPRLEPATCAPFTQDSGCKVSDRDFKHLMTVIRLAIPYTGMIITARESAQMRNETLGLGWTQTDASTRIGVGAYSDSYSEQKPQSQQFVLGDTRTLNELIYHFSKQGCITSFCTAGYRCGRTGVRIMNLLRSGQEGKFCKLNAVLTFREWLDDFADELTKQAGEKVIAKEIKEVEKKMPGFFPKMVEYYNRVKEGQRDLYF